MNVFQKTYFPMSCALNSLSGAGGAFNAGFVSSRNAKGFCKPNRFPFMVDGRYGIDLKILIAILSFSPF